MDAGRPALQPHWFDQELTENRTKLALTEQLAALAEEIGTTLPTLATAFPLTHRAVTFVIIGPRTIDQLQRTLAGAALTLDDNTLDRIEEIVAPGIDHHTRAPPHLEEPSDRRRPPSRRAAAQADELTREVAGPPTRHRRNERGAGLNSNRRESGRPVACAEKDRLPRRTRIAVVSASTNHGFH